MNLFYKESKSKIIYIYFLCGWGGGGGGGLSVFLKDPDLNKTFLLRGRGSGGLGLVDCDFFLTKNLNK